MPPLAESVQWIAASCFRSDTMAPTSLLQHYEALLEAVLAELRRGYRDRLVAVAVFGSVGRGTPRDDSDVDLLIVARDPPRRRLRRVEQFLPMEARLERDLGSVQEDGTPVMLSPIFRTPAEVERRSALFLDMVEDARILCTGS